MGDILKGCKRSCYDDEEEQYIDSAEVQICFDEEFLQKNQYLGEFSEQATLPDGTVFNEKEKARDNLDVYSRDEVDDKIDWEHDHMLDTVNSTMRAHLDAEDPHGDRAYVDSITQQQQNAITTQLNNLKNNIEATLSRSLSTFLKTGDFEQFRQELLCDIARKLSNTYSKDKLYTKLEIDVLNEQFVKKDGSVPFVRPQTGVDPRLDKHLATKRYVDNAFAHASDFLNNVEFRNWINQKLAVYAKLSDTYSRSVIDSKLESLVESSVDAALNRELANILDDHLNTVDPHGDRAYADGKFVPYDTLATLGTTDVPSLTEELRTEITNKVDTAIEQNIPVWQSSGPVQSTVGFVEDNTDFEGKEFTLQSIMDMIFYGRGVYIDTSDNTVILGNKTYVSIRVQGSSENIDNIVVKQNGVIISVLDISDLDLNNVATLLSDPVVENTTFTVEVNYVGVDNPITATKQVTIGSAVFIGIIDKFQNTTAITWNDLLQLTRSDSTNNEFFSTGPDGEIEDIEKDFDFTSSTQKQILVAVPATSPDISEMSVSLQSYDIDAFNIINQIPMNIPVEGQNPQQVLYKFMIYKQGLNTLDTTVLFKF